MSIRWLVFCLALSACGFADAQSSPAQMHDDYAQTARQDDASFGGFSAERGRAFFNATHGRDWSCASCHTADPTRAGRHAVTARPLEPLAPAANARRFTDPAKTEKWFRRNCNDVLGRACTALEKGDVIAWLIRLPAGGGP